MSNLVVANVGENIINDRWVASIGANISLRLFQNNYTPVAASVIGNFTIATFPGYASLVPAFGASVTVGGKGTITDAAARVFTCTGGGAVQTIYGYYVVDTANAQVIYAERFDNPVPIVNNGDSITITLVFTADSQF